MKMTSTMLLNRMKADAEYTIMLLAIPFDMPPCPVRDLLEELVREGHVTKRYSRTKGQQLYRKKQVAMVMSVSGVTDPTRDANPSVATFRVTGNLQGQLSDYDATLIERRSLAMITRNRKQ